jgi:hypothetical protein
LFVCSSQAGNSDPDPDQELAQLLRSMRSLNVLCDLIFVADAALYGGYVCNFVGVDVVCQSLCRLWYKERQEEQALQNKTLVHVQMSEDENDDFRDMRRMMWGVSAKRLPTMEEHAVENEFSEDISKPLT